MAKTKRKRAKRSTKAEVETRVALVAEMILAGYTYSDIVRYGAETWKVSSRQVDKYNSAAADYIAVSADKHKNKQFQIAVNRLTKLYRKTIEAKKYTIALEVQKDINKLFGLYAPEKKTISMEVLIGALDDSEIDTNIRELESYLAGHSDGSEAVGAPSVKEKSKS